MNDILFLPVKPKWANLIIEGKKNIELRKRLPLNGFGNPCLIYSSSPRREVVGSCNLTQSFTIPRDGYTLTVFDRSCVTSADFREYIGNASQLYGLELLAPRRFKKPILLGMLRDRWRLEPPQQWRYIDRKTFDEIVEAGR